MSPRSTARAGSLAARAALLVGLAIGFWALAAGMTCALVVLGRWIVDYAPQYSYAGFAAWGVAAALVVGVFPGRLRSGVAAPPRVAREHARLRAFVTDVARRAGGREPDRIYVFHEANAFAGTRRDGVFARRESVIGVGLPLFALLTEDELRSVLAHEMGHHLAADVKLGPWVHRARRTVARAADRFEGSSFWLHLPFLAYAELFMRTSLRVSRAQELSADARAVRVAGAAATASALRKIEVLGTAWNAYFESEVVPVVERKRLPSLLEGFRTYWQAAQAPGTPAFEQLTEALKRRGTSSVEDTHPSLAERLAAIGQSESPVLSLSLSSAVSLDLLDAVSETEEQVVRELLRDAGMKLDPVGWDAVVDDVWLPTWREVADLLTPVAELELADLAGALARWETIAAATRRGLALTSPEAERRRVTKLLSAWLTVKLAGEGFRVSAAPGQAVRAERDDAALEPFTIVAKLANGEIDAQAWTALRAAHRL